MALYKLVGLESCDCCNATHELATMDDIKAVLGDMGMIAMPVDPGFAILRAGIRANNESCGNDMNGSTLAVIYTAMIAAPQKEQG